MVQRSGEVPCALTMNSNRSRMATECHSVVDYLNTVASGSDLAGQLGWQCLSGKLRQRWRQAVTEQQGAGAEE